MFKKITAGLFGRKAGQAAADGFFLDVRCDMCGERFHLYINKSWELMQNFEPDGSVTYCLNKEIFGVGCRNRLRVHMKFDSHKNLVSKQIENGQFIEA